MNFRNSDPPAAYKTNRISGLLEASKANIEMGSNLVNEADELVQTAAENFERLRDMQDQMESRSADSAATIEADSEAINGRNVDLLNQAGNHAYDLERQAGQFESILAQSKVLYI